MFSETQIMNRDIYNLEFPSWCTKIELFGYIFVRVEEYEERLKQLQHLVSAHSEFSTQPNTGGHAITATVEHEDPEPKAILEWAGDTSTALMDLLLLLSLFTKRDVFAAPKEEGDRAGVIVRDHRVYAHGGILQLSIPYVGQPIDPEPYKYNIGFEQGLNRIYELILDEGWRTFYRGAYFLFLANQAFRWQTLEASFTQCWTIWEHIFSVHNSRWLSDNSIRNMGSHEKISYVLATYSVLEEVDEASRKKIGALTKIRNRLVHFGRFTKQADAQEDACLFI
jgi:hypothetical protein